MSNRVLNLKDVIAEFTERNEFVHKLSSLPISGFGVEESSEDESSDDDFDN